MSHSIYIELNFEDKTGIRAIRVLQHPVSVFVAESHSDVREVVARAEAAAKAGFVVAGYMAYEAAEAFGYEVIRDDSALEAPPLALFAAFQDEAVPARAGGGAGYQVGKWTPEIDHARYNASVGSIRASIAAGDVYQVNLTYSARAAFAGCPLQWYRDLVSGNHGRYNAYIEFGRWAFISVSPELFFRTDQRCIVTRPMKGTAKRGFNNEVDEAVRCRLARSAKDRAENVMIVDLMRNDIGRISCFGTVEVNDLFRVEKFPTVFQMTSTVTGELRDRVGLVEIFEHLFPAGSITGAPKIMAASLIAGIERSRRGVYCGSIGVLLPDGTASFNVAIRTVTIDRDLCTASVGIGGAITWDSAAEAEFEETLAKCRFLSYPRFELLETMRLESGGFFLLDRHLHRLSCSAQFFGIGLDMDAASADLQSSASAHGDGKWRVRLTVDQHGNRNIECKPLELVSLSQPVAICRDHPIDVNTPFVYHKTTHRRMYEECRALYPDAFDVLLQNGRGRYTEFTIGNLVIEVGGRLLTPPTCDGLLAGTFRQELLETRAIEEASIDDALLSAAERVWLINSVRGWIPVEFLNLDAAGSEV